MIEGASNRRVLLACDWFVKYTAALARGLADIGCDVALLTRDHDLEFGDEQGAMRAYVDEALDGRARHLELGGRVRDLSRLGEVVSLRRAFRHWDPEVIHIQDSLANDMRLAVAAGYPWRRYALTNHDPTPHPGDPRQAARIRAIRRSLCRRAALVFVHSAALAEEVRVAGDVRGHVEIVPHGFGEATVEPLPECPSLLFFGRISRYKGLDTLLEAMPLVWQHLPQVTLTIAGSGPLPNHESLEDPRVKLRHEHVPEAAVPGLFASSTCVVLPYRQASQSGVGSEAKQHGRAIVATAVGGLPELVDSECGRLVPPEDPPALARAIIEVVGTPGLASELGSNGAGSVDEAGWRSVAEKTLEAYEGHLIGP